ncbi:hypothetical protein [Streptomyces erythrochromogenes]|uniref:hypothetical protein n=1 Tax=Streptomyces erythrochromogenes TaxID=285574 RepID=UPI00131EBFF6|nr:hypothetical protein [Streptomyces erythrochromogenes]
MALHGAARLAAGLEPTDLEAHLVEMLRGVLTEEEVQDFGGVYTQEPEGRSRLFPECLAKLSVEEGYSQEDLARDLPLLAPEIVEQANIRVVDLDAAEDAKVPGARTDEEFDRGAAVHGCGAVVMTASGQPPAAAGAPPLLLRMHLTKFWCYRESNEWSGSDEIFWASCAAADEGTKQTRMSRTHGDVDKGETHYLDVGTTVFEGTVSNALIAHIECWEKDQGSAETIRRMLSQMTTTLRTTAEKLALLPLGDWAASKEYSAMAGMIAELVHAVIQAAADDWVAGHVFTYDRAALQRLSGAEFKIGSFIGEIVAADGGHELYGRIDPITSGPLEYVVRTGTTWGTPMTLPFRTIITPALAVHAGRLYLAYVRPEDQAVMWASMDADGTWTQPARIHADTTFYGPTLTSAGGKLHYAVTGKDEKVYTRTYTSTSGWSSAYQQMPGRKRYSPALATYENQAWLVAYGLDNNLYHSRYNGTSWSGWAKDDLGWELSTHVALAPRGARLWRIATGKAGQIHTSINGGGTWVSEGIPNPNWRSSHAPALAGNGNAMTLLIRGSDSSLWSAEFDGSWAGALKVANITMLETPAAVYFGGKLHMMYRRTAS